MSLKLSDGSRVCIVGGGPAGCFAGLHLLELARHQGLHLEILLFEPRDFTSLGPAGCNRCAGILSSRLLLGLEHLGLHLPDEMLETEIRAYSIHVSDHIYRIEQPDPDRRILSVYRGGGPRQAEGLTTIGFDAFLLSQIKKQGVTHIAERVRSITWDDGPQLHTTKRSYPADLVVLASGINSRAPLDAHFGYRPPATVVMAQDEFLIPPHWPTDQVNAYFGKMPGLTFGALTPKGRYMNVSLMGSGLRLDSVSVFANEHGLPHDMFTAASSLCGCTPRIAVGPSRRAFGERWVAVGDAAVTRLYKDGIGSAFYISKVAMETAINHGISKQAFRRGYAPYCAQVHRDNQYGRILFLLWQMTMRQPLLLDAWMHAIRAEANAAPERRVHIRILWGMLTGDEPYRSLFWLSLSPGSLLNLGRGLRHVIGMSHDSIIGTTD